jgi:hypothetical protein
MVGIEWYRVRVTDLSRGKSDTVVIIVLGSHVTVTFDLI